MNAFFWAALIVAVLGVALLVLGWRQVTGKNHRPDDWGAMWGVFVLFCIAEIVAAVLAVCGLVVAVFF